MRIRLRTSIRPDRAVGSPPRQPPRWNFNTPGPGSGFPSETAASVNGSRMGGVYYQLDGLVAMNNYFQTADPFPNADATEEFHVLTNNFDAQYGYTAGAVVSVVTKGGTNQWHR